MIQIIIWCITVFTNLDCLWVHRSVQMASDKYKACICFPWSCPTSLHCLQVAITTPERGSWGYPYIKIYPCRQPTQPRKDWPYHQSLQPARLFSNSGVGPFMSHNNPKLEEGAYTRRELIIGCILLYKGRAYNWGGGGGAFKGKSTVSECFYTKQENHSSFLARVRLPEHPTIIPSHWFAMISAAFKEKVIYVRLSVVKNVNLVLSNVLPILKMNH